MTYVIQFIIENHTATTILTTVFICIPLFAGTDALAVYLWYKK